MNHSNTVWRVILASILVGLILAVLDLLIVTVSVLLLLFAGALFGILLNGVCHWTSRWTRLPYAWSYTAVLVVLVAVVIGGAWYLGGQLAQQASALWSELDSAVGDAERHLRQTEWGKQLIEYASDQEGDSAGVQQWTPHIWSGLQSIAWNVTGLLVIFFVGVYVAFDPELYRRGLVKLVPPSRRNRADEVLQTLRNALTRWIVGRLISMAIVGVFTAVGLSLLGVPLAIPLGVVAALLTFIPNLGPVVAAIPQVLLALQIGTDTAVYVIVFNIALQAVESYLITPIVQQIEVSLPPALVIFVQLLMAVLLGVIGAMMAAPLTVAMMVLVQMLYIQDRLGDPKPGQLTKEAQA